MPEPHKSFFAEHRHRVGHGGHSTEIVLVCQDLSQIAYFVRNLVETTYRSVKLSAVGMTKTFRIDVYAGPVTGPRPPESLRQRQIPGKFSSSVYRYYTSHTMSLTGESGDESRVDNRHNILKSLRIIMIPIGLIGALFMIFLLSKIWVGFFGSNNSKNVVVAHSSNAIKDRKPVNDVLGRKQLTIVRNNGVYPDYDYVVDVSEDDRYYRLSRLDMLRLGYKLQPINQCLLRVTVGQVSYVASCVRESANQQFVDFNFKGENVIND